MDNSKSLDNVMCDTMIGDYEKKKENIIATVKLRAVDVVLFAGEKMLTVRIFRWG